MNDRVAGREQPEDAEDDRKPSAHCDHERPRDCVVGGLDKLPPGGERRVDLRGEGLGEPLMKAVRRLESMDLRIHPDQDGRDLPAFDATGLCEFRVVAGSAGSSGQLSAIAAAMYSRRIARIGFASTPYSRRWMSRLERMFPCFRLSSLPITG